MKKRFYSMPILVLLMTLMVQTTALSQDAAAPAAAPAHEAAPVVCAGYTLTQGAYGSTGNGAGPRVLSGFTGSLTIGCTNTLTLTGVSAITDFLPSGTEPRALEQSLVDPGSTYRNVFAGQLVALTLNLNFDPGLGDQIMIAGSLIDSDDGSTKSISPVFAGLTVSQFLSLANQKIGGCTLSAPYNGLSASTFSEAADVINNNYDNGANHGLLSCCDTKGPRLLNVSDSQTINCPATPQFSLPTAIDDQDGDLTAKIKVTEVRTNGQCSGTYSVTRTWTVTDKCNNTTTASQTITVQDVTAPAFDSGSLPDATVATTCDNVPAAANVTATDNCTGATVTMKESRADGTCAGNYILTRIWTAVDGCNNSTSFTQTITVTDGTAPVFDGLPEATVSTSCDNVPVAANVTATDNCTGATVTMEETRTDGNCAGNYTLTRTWTAVDGCKNSTSFKQTITVTDGTAPVLNGLPGATVSASCDNVPAAANVTATDNCTGATVTMEETRTDGDCAGNYTLTRTWTAVDGCKNSTSFTQTITVTDGTAPVFDHLPEATLSASCDNVPAAANVTATDNCTGATVTMVESRTDGNCTGNYTLVRTWTAVDGCKNSTSFTQTITVTDGTAPVFDRGSLPDASVSASCDNVPTAANVTATDNCTGATVTIVETRIDGNCASNYTLVRTWTAADGCGNKSTFTQKISVTDNTPPVIAALPGTTTISCGTTPVFAQATATDGCSSVTLTSTIQTINDCLKGGYTITKSWVATDACGNTSTASQTITVISCEQVTVTQGGWGAPASGNNWGTYLSKNFASAFPNGLTVGSTTSGKYVTLKTSTDVHNFLPNSGTPTALTKGWLNPTSKTLKNTLAGQAVALTLNIKFWPSIANLVVKSGQFSGISVQGMLNIANTLLGGGSTGYSASDVNDVVNSININFDGGANLGFLTCPAVGSRDSDVASTEETLRENPSPANDLVTLSSYPNPFNGRVKIEFSVQEDSHINLQLFNSSGVSVQTLFEGAAEKGVQYKTEYISSSPGLYIYRMSTPRGIISGKVLHIN